MRRKKLKIHYAWICCLAGALLFFSTIGLSSNCYSVYQPFISERFGLTQTKLSLMNTARQITGILAMALLGVYYQKVPLKWGMTAGALLSVAGYALLSLSKSYPMLLLGCAVTGLGNNIAGMVPISMLLDRWFLKDKSLAVSLCSASSGIATFLAPSLITGAIGRFGLSATLFGQAVFMALLVLTCAFLFVDSPKMKHLVPYGEEDSAAAEASVKGPEKVLSGASCLPVFFMMFLMGGLSGCAIALLPLVATSSGYNAQQMALSVSAGGLALVVGKILYGILCEKITQYKTTLLFGVVMIGGLICLRCCSRSAAFLYLGSIFYIGTLAMIAIGMISWTQDWFAPEKWMRYRQLFNLIFNVGNLSFSVIPGFLADRSGGSYMPAVTILLGESVVCLLILYFTYRSLKN